MKKFRKDLIGTSSIPSVLCLLNNGDSYGYQIVKELKEVSEGRIHWKEGSIYPVLQKMEKQDLIESYWKMSENERSRKYFKITDLGRKTMNEMMDELNDLVSIINNLYPSK